MDATMFEPVDYETVKPPKRAEETRIGEIVKPWQGEEFPKGAHVLIGVPDDFGVTLSKGRAGASEGPTAFRREFYRMTLGFAGELKNTLLWDVGNLRISKNQTVTYEALAVAIAGILEQGAFPIMIGGGHDLTYGSLAGFLSMYPKGGVFNVDPHFDCRLPEEDGSYSSGTAFRHLLDDQRMRGDQLVQFGFQSQCNSKPHYDFLAERHAHLISWNELSVMDIPARFQQVYSKMAQDWENIALTFDLDAMEASAAPGVSAINPNGLTVNDALRIVTAAAHSPATRYLDIMELNPSCDDDARTARLAALLVFTFLAQRV